MGPIFGFFTGIVALVGSMAISFNEESKYERQFNENIENGYSPIVQNRYFNDEYRLFTIYDQEKVIAAIKRDYPNMNYYVAYSIAKEAVIKKLMEAETNYKYKPTNTSRFFDLDRYTLAEYLKKERATS